MYLIAKQKGGYKAIPIKSGDRWDFHKLLIGRKEVRIILRVRGRQYLLYHTQDLAAKYTMLNMPQMTVLCDEIIAKTSECIERRDRYIEFDHICKAAVCRHHRRWRDQGLITPAIPELYHGHPIDPQTESLSTRVRANLDNIVVMDPEPPVNCDQEHLPE